MVMPGGGGGGGGSYTTGMNVWANSTNITPGQAVTIDAYPYLYNDEPDPYGWYSTVGFYGSASDGTNEYQVPATFYPTTTTTYTVSGSWDVIYTDDNGSRTVSSGNDQQTITITVTPITPTLSSLNGGSSCLIGASYTLSGSNLSNVTSVTINGVSASFSINSSSSITVTIPQMSSYGGVNVTATSSGGSSTITGYITYPTVSINNGYAELNVGSITLFSAYISGLNDTTNGTWSCSSGSMSGAYYYAPSTIPYDGYPVTLTFTPSGNPSSAASTPIYIYRLPSNLSLSASTTSPLRGGTFTLTPSWSDGSSATLTDVATFYNGQATGAFTQNWGSGGKVYTLTVRNRPGYSVSTNLTITPQAVSITAISGSSTMTVGYSQYFSGAIVSGAADTSVTWSASAGTNPSSGSINSSTGYFTAPNTTGTIWITARSVADSSTYANLQINIVAAPSITSFTAYPSTNPPYNTSCSVTGVFSGGSGSISNGVGAVSSGTAYSIGSITSSKSYTLTVTNAAGNSTTSTLTVTPQTESISISPASPSAYANGTVSFTGTISGSANTGVSWSATGGSFSSASTTSGGATTWTAPSSGGSYTITASVSGGVASTSTTASVQGPPTVSSFNGGSYANMGASVTIAGTNFSGASSVSVGGVSASFTVNSSSQITLTIPALNSTQLNNGTPSILVTTPAGTNAGNTLGRVNTPSVTVSPSTKNVSAGGAVTYSYSVSNVSNTSATWSSTGGSFSTNTWTAPTPSTNPTSYTITATSVGAPAWSGSATATVYKLPIATSLVSSNNSPKVGESFTLTPTFSNTNSAYVGTSVGSSSVSSSPTSGTALTLTATVGLNQVYYLTGYNVPGDSASVSTSAAVVAQTVSVGSISGNANQSVSTAQTFSGAAVSGAVNTSVTWSTSGNAGSWSGATWTAPATTGTYTITATSVADSSKTATFSVTVVALPTISSFVSSKNPQTNNKTITVTGTFSGGSGSVSPTIGSVTSGTASSAITPPSSTTTRYTLTVTNAAGSSTGAYIDQQMVAAPTATSLVASTTTPLYGGTFYLTPTYSGGTGSIDNGISCPASGSNTSNITHNWGSSSRTYTLTVTNAAGDTSTASTTVTPQTVSVGALSGSTYQTVSTSQTFSAPTVSGASDSSVTWSVSAGTNSNTGSITSGGVYMAPSTSGTVNVKATSSADSSKYSTFTVTVVDSPSITSLTSSAGTNPGYNSPVSLTAVFAGGSGVVNQSVGSVTSGVSTAVTNATTTKTYTLTVTNQAGTSTQQSITITPQSVSSTISPASVTFKAGQQIQLSATTTGGYTNNVSWTATGGSFSPTTTASGEITTWTAPTTSGNVTITATSSDNTGYSVTRLATQLLQSGKKSAAGS